MSVVKCPDCSKGYCDDISSDVRDHELYHQQFLEAKELYGFMYTHNERERLKGELHKIYSDDTVLLDEKILAYEKLFKVYFSRSLEASKFSKQHVNLATYIAMLLHHNHWRERLTPAIHSVLLARYGSLPGIEDGKTYYVVK